MINYTYTFATSGDVQTAHTNGELGNPYVAYITSTSGLDWNSLNIPQPVYIGEWTNHTFTLTDTGSTAWTEEVHIATIPTAYIDGTQVAPKVTLRNDNGWILKIDDEEESGYDEFEINLSQTGSAVTEYVHLNGPDDSDDIFVSISWDNYTISFESTMEGPNPLVMNTINPEG